MPMRDHFHPPLSEVRHWESFRARFASTIADTLEAELLPEGYFAEVQIHVGARIEVEVATFEENHSSVDQPIASDGGVATATAPAVWTPSRPDMTAPATYPPRVEILVFNTERGPKLVGAIELISPRNKDREPSRRAFAVKCANYLHHGVGLLTVDMVTTRRVNLHNEMARLLNWTDDYLLDANALFAIAYRPVRRSDHAEIDIWTSELTVGQDLPTLPLALDKGQCIRIDLEDLYARTCHRMRLPAE